MTYSRTSLSVLVAAIALMSWLPASPSGSWLPPSGGRGARRKSSSSCSRTPPIDFELQARTANGGHDRHPRQHARGAVAALQSFRNDAHDQVSRPAASTSGTWGGAATRSRCSRARSTSATPHAHLTEQKADVILAFFGLNESFDGEAGLPKFEQDLEAYLQAHAAARYNGSVSAASRAGVADRARAARAPGPRRRRRAQPRAGALHRGDAPRRRGAAGDVFVDLFTPTKRADECLSHVASR